MEVLPGKTCASRVIFMERQEQIMKLSLIHISKGKKERVGRILQMHANKRQELDKVYAGDIAAAVGFKLSLIHI